MYAWSNGDRVVGSDHVAGPPVAGSPGILSHLPGLPALGLMMAGYQAGFSTSSRGMLSGMTVRNDGCPWSWARGGRVAPNRPSGWPTVGTCDEDVSAQGCARTTSCSSMKVPPSARPLGPPPSKHQGRAFGLSGAGYDSSRGAPGVR